MFTGAGLIAFLGIFGAGAAGLLFSGLLPADHRLEATPKAVHMIMSVVGLLAALVLGLLVASAKSGFDTSSKEIEQFSTSLVLLDREAAHLGAESGPVRDLLRTFTREKIAQTWRGPGAADHSLTVKLLDDIQTRVRALVPPDDVTREARTSALKYIDDLKQTSRMLAVQQERHVPRYFLIVVVFWISVMFFSYAIFAPPNATVFVALVVGAFSVAAAVNLIADMDHPFVGFINVSKAPMQQALDSMSR